MNHGPVKAKIVELVPGIRTYENRCYGCGFGFEFCKCTPKSTEWYKDRPITLADVLRASQHTAPLQISLSWKDGVALMWVTMGDREHVEVEWNLTTDYDGQTQEVKEFVGKLFGV